MFIWKLFYFEAITGWKVLFPAPALKTLPDIQYKPTMEKVQLSPTEFFVFPQEYTMGKLASTLEDMAEIANSFFADRSAFYEFTWYCYYLVNNTIWTACVIFLYFFPKCF